MTGRLALPGLTAGALGLAAGLIGLGLDAPSFGAMAGLLALAAGVAGLRVTQQLHEQAAVQALIEEELRKVRSEARDTESKLREELEATDVPFAADGATPLDPIEGAWSEDRFYDDDEGPDPLIDDTTGLFSENFFLVALDSRIAAARRHLRPVSVVLIDVVDGLPANDPTPANAESVAVAVRQTLREADTACRMRNGDFALLLEDTPENGAIWTVERIRRCVLDHNPGLTLWAGVACYPAHAFSSPDILKAADTALDSAREWRQDRIEVALTEAD